MALQFSQTFFRPLFYMLIMMSASINAEAVEVSRGTLAVAAGVPLAISAQIAAHRAEVRLANMKADLEIFKGLPDPGPQLIMEDVAGQLQVRVIRKETTDLGRLIDPARELVAFTAWDEEGYGRVNYDDGWFLRNQEVETSFIAKSETILNVEERLLPLFEEQIRPGQTDGTQIHRETQVRISFRRYVRTDILTPATGLVERQFPRRYARTGRKSFIIRNSAELKDLFRHYGSSITELSAEVTDVYKEHSVLSIEQIRSHNQRVREVLQKLNADYRAHPEEMPVRIEQQALKSKRLRWLKNGGVGILVIGVTSLAIDYLSGEVTTESCHDHFCQRIQGAQPERM